MGAAVEANAIEGDEHQRRSYPDAGGGWGAAGYEFVRSLDLTGHAGAPGRGAFLILFLKLDDDRIAAAKYHTYGCGPTIASGSMLTELIVGRTISECRELQGGRGRKRGT